MCSLCVLKLVHQALKTVAKSVVKMRVSDSLYFPTIFDEKGRSGGGRPYIYIYIYRERERERGRERFIYNMNTTCLTQVFFKRGE